MTTTTKENILEMIQKLEAKKVHYPRTLTEAQKNRNIDKEIRVYMQILEMEA